MTLVMSPFVNANGSHPDPHSAPHNGTRLDDEIAVARLEADIAAARSRAAGARERIERAEATTRETVAPTPSMEEIEARFANAIQSVRDAARLEAARIVDDAHRTARGNHVV